MGQFLPSLHVASKSQWVIIRVGPFIPSLYFVCVYKMGTLSNLFTLTIARSQNAIEMINFREAGKKMKCLLSYLSILITGEKKQIFRRRTEWRVLHYNASNTDGSDISHTFCCNNSVYHLPWFSIATDLKIITV